HLLVLLVEEQERMTLVLLHALVLLLDLQRDVQGGGQPGVQVRRRRIGLRLALVFVERDTSEKEVGVAFARPAAQPADELLALLGRVLQRLPAVPAVEDLRTVEFSDR